ncbi:MAG: hypothetical protein ABI846_00320 [Rudaea sp.]
MRMRHFAPMVITAVLAAGMWSGDAAAAGKIDCKMKFNLRGWSALYKHAEGAGVISCDNGRAFNVNIVAVGGGLTVGKYRVDNGTGKFAEVNSVDELFGDYAQGEANAGVVKSGVAQILTKGTSSLALAGEGEGVNLGISFGKFTISRAK